MPYYILPEPGFFFPSARAQHQFIRPIARKVVEGLEVEEKIGEK